MSDGRKTVFLVDDGASNLAAGRALLAPAYRVFTCASAERMFRALERATPDLILLDVEMPGMDGMEALRRLKSDARSAGIPVIFVSARDDEESRAAGLSLGAADYVARPFAESLLLERVEASLGGPRPAGSGGEGPEGRGAAG